MNGLPHALAAEYALGTLDGEERSVFEKHLAEGCAACEAEMLSVRATVATLALAVPEQAPPDSLRDKLLRQLEAQPEKPKRVLVRTDEKPWKASGYPGVFVRHLFLDKATGAVTSMLKVEPGAVYPAHRHAGPEHTFVLEGDVVFDDHSLQAGDYEVALGESLHSAVTTTHGCVVLITHHRLDQIFP